MMEAIKLEKFLYLYFLFSATLISIIIKIYIIKLGLNFLFFNLKLQQISHIFYFNIFLSL